MTSTPLPWGPREGKILCVVELDLPPGIDRREHTLDNVLRMSIDYCASSVWKERLRVDPLPPAPKSLLDFKSLSELNEYFKRNREGERWYPRVEVIPPTTLFTNSQQPGVRINLSLPPEIADEVRDQFNQKWHELMGDIQRCGIDPFHALYSTPSGIFGGGPPVKPDFPLSRWGPLLVSSGLICTKNSQPRYPGLRIQ
jgi:hypothetical protein